MRALFAIVGLFGILLMPLPSPASAGPSKTAQVGLASWYGAPHEGRKTASGERFSRRRLTAAHRSLPLGTQVQVTNLRTKQDVIITINDRGPYGAGRRRIIDLSEAAAQRIGLRERGTERVHSLSSGTPLRGPVPRRGRPLEHARVCHAGGQGAFHHIPPMASRPRAGEQTLTTRSSVDPGGCWA
jgi:rare lipoprotein A